MYTHLLAQITQQHPDWKESTIKNTLLLVALILSEKTVNLWKLKAGVSKQLGNTGVDSRSHYQRLKRWLWQEKATPGMWIQIAKASLSLLGGQTDCFIIDGSSWKSADLSFSDFECALPRRERADLVAGTVRRCGWVAWVKAANGIANY